MTPTGTLRFRDPIVHFIQEKKYSCGAAVVAMLFDLDEKTARKIVGTTSNGTNQYGALAGLTRHGVKATIVDLSDAHYKTLFWLGPLCCRFPLLLNCTFINKSIHNRTVKRHHAVLAANGFLYDPSEDRATPVDTFESTFNKDLVIEQMIVVDYELPNWRKQWQRMGFAN
jgi:hypothetical protein